jgi:hypothetical protein
MQITLLSLVRLREALQVRCLADPVTSAVAQVQAVRVARAWSAVSGNPGEGGGQAMFDTFLVSHDHRH